MVFLVILASAGAAAPGDTQIEKPSVYTDYTGNTTAPENAFDLPDTVDTSTFSSTVEDRDANASITWHDWTGVNSGKYASLSMTVTMNTSDFNFDSWYVYMDNTTDTICNGEDTLLTGSESLSSNINTQNVTMALPADQDLSLLETCIVIDVDETLGPDEGSVNMIDIRTNGTIETANPLWRNQQQNLSRIVQGEPVNLAAQGNDTGNLSHAILATNETGAWANKSGNYSSPLPVYTRNTWTWSNFTWSNASVTAGSPVGWRIWYNDTAGNWNMTDTQTFTLKPPFLDVQLADPPTPFTATQNATFTLNATVTCRRGNCGEVNGTARYNASSTDPDTQIPASGEPFHTTRKTNPLTCGNSLARDTTCNTTWHVDATGDAGSVWLVDVNLSSDVDTVESNDTDDTEIKISPFAIDIALQWEVIDFGDLFVGETDNPAVNNSDGGYNITVTDETTENVDIWLNMTDLTQEDGDDVIGASNMSVGTENDPATADPLASTFSLLTSNIAPDTNVTTYYWLDTPLGIFADNYTGTLWVKANETT
jgi:hypothetical protein